MIQVIIIFFYIYILVFCLFVMNFNIILLLFFNIFVYAVFFKEKNPIYLYMLSFLKKKTHQMLVNWSN